MIEFEMWIKNTYYQKFSPQLLKTKNSGISELNTVSEIKHHEIILYIPLLISLMYLIDEN